MLPQSAALGVSSEQKGKAKPSTSEIRAVFQHDRGERPALSAGPSPAKRRETSVEESGVTRVFCVIKGRGTSDALSCRASQGIAGQGQSGGGPALPVCDPVKAQPC